jgi:LEA14-like dessication related protein
MNRRFILAAVLSFVLLQAGCAGLKIQSPSVTLAGMELIEAGLFEQRFAFKLRVQNPNDSEISITGLSFSVEINGQPFAKGVSDKPATVPRFGEAVLEVAAVSNLTGILRQVNELRRTNREEISYRIRGRLTTGSFAFLSFDESGKL